MYILKYLYFSDIITFVVKLTGGALMARSLVIVESPAKAKTIEKFLGKKNYKVKASIGHIRDLPKSKMGIDIENNYEPEYITIRGKGKIIKELKEEAKKAAKVYLATDPDREGEAISWHLANILSLDENSKCRIEFNEITSKAIKAAIKKPREINKNLVDAQQARRVLDRLVGYSISPLLWRKVRKGLSAGRVQSVATKIICDREMEIQNFKPEEFWTIVATFASSGNSAEFEASFYGKENDKVDLKDKEETDFIIESIRKNPFIISDIERKEKNRSPYPPFTTSSLQQEAYNKYGFSTKKTMLLAQQLYEGIDLKKEGTVGLITYMRTDSTRISEEAQREAREFIIDNFSEKYLGKTNKKTQTKKENAQDAHEAIRPTSVRRTPEDIKDSLTNDQYKLYKLIWERFLSSQMADSVYISETITIRNGDYIFKAKGIKQEFDGFLKIYSFSSVTEKELPSLKTNEEVLLKDLKAEQHFTQPPPRFTEATLVKEMEENGIGRPSTYAPTISTILSRGYVIKEGKYLKPTELGFLVNDLLMNHFPEIIDIDFTAELEKKLDKIEMGEANWKEVIDQFYKPFTQLLKKAEKDIEKIDLTELTEEKCEKCGKPLAVKHGRFGKFLACSNYPECDFTKSIQEKIGIKCPKCNEGEIIIRKSKKGRVFYGCSNFPKCRFTSWHMPLNKICPECISILVLQKKKNKDIIKCSNKECKYTEEANK